MKKIVTAFFLVGLGLCNAALADDVFDNVSPKPFSLGAPLEPGTTLGGYPLWHDDGQWRVFDVDMRQTTSNLPVGRVNLFQVEGHHFVGLMHVTANLRLDAATRWTDQPCDRPGVLFKTTVDSQPDNVKCLTISHVSGYFQRTSGPAGYLRDWLDAHEVDLPPTVLRVTATRYAESGRLLQVSLDINPELFGFARADTDWDTNPWHPDQVANDPDKKRLVDAIARWSLKFGRQIDHAFEQESNAFATLPALHQDVASYLEHATNQQRLSLVKLPPTR